DSLSCRLTTVARLTSQMMHYVLPIRESSACLMQWQQSTGSDQEATAIMMLLASEKIVILHSTTISTLPYLSLTCLMLSRQSTQLLMESCPLPLRTLHYSGN